MFYINDNIFVCSHVLSRIVDKYVILHTITGLALETLIASVELLNAFCGKGANFKCCNWGIDHRSVTVKNPKF